MISIHGKAEGIFPNPHSQKPIMKLNQFTFISSKNYNDPKIREFIKLKDTEHIPNFKTVMEYFDIEKVCETFQKI
jgi:hypothetical protein